MDLKSMVACPVCTLYLREGMSMHSHLDTHPKDQVIDAFVRMYATERSISYQQAPIISAAAPIAGPFVPVVSEVQTSYRQEQIQTASIIHQPLIPYPMYNQQPYIQTTGHYVSEPQGYSDNVDVMHTQLPIETHKTESSNLKSEVMFVTPEMEEEEGSTSVNSPRSAGHDSAKCEVYDEYLLCNYQDEAARHADHESTKNQGDLEPELERRMDQSLETEERMPPQGEITDPSPHPEWAHYQEPLQSNDNVWDLRNDPTDRKQEENRFPCLYCEEILDNPTERRLHIASIHTTTTVVMTQSLPDKDKLDIKLNKICVKCDQTFTTIKSLRAHNKTEHPKIINTCEVCNSMFIDRKSYMEHIASIHPLECKQCGKTFLKPIGLKHHAKTHLIVKPHPCHLCPKTFVTPQKLKEHINGHTGEAPIQCDLCDKSFKRYSNLKQHKDTTHFKIKKKKTDIFCHCGESFPTKKKLMWHQETHEAKPKPCPYCSEKFLHVTSLTRHIRRSHNPEYIPQNMVDKVRNVQCHICGTTVLQMSLASHMKQHNEQKKHSCVICGKRFFKKWNLNLHRWTHASRISKPYKCNSCKAAFIRFGDFQAHVRSHLGHKPYTCNHCGMQFIRKQNWQRHEKEHSGNKSFPCNQCGKTFFRSYYLTEHLRVHSGEKPFACHICNKMSSTKSNHNKHLKTHHAREVLNTEV